MLRCVPVDMLLRYIIAVVGIALVKLLRCMGPTRKLQETKRRFSSAYTKVRRSGWPLGTVHRDSRRLLGFSSTSTVARPV